MLLYFSATGNGKYLADRLYEREPQEQKSIPDCMRAGEFSFSDESSIGLIVPTYNFGPPSLVLEFLKNASFETPYLYLVASYGTTPGAIGAIVNRAIRGREVDAYYSVRMPDTWTPIFDLSTPEKVAKVTVTTEAQVNELLQKVGERHRNRGMRPRVPTFVADLIAQPIYNHIERKTRHFSVEDSCIGCGKCARNCPVSAIAMENKKPVWVKEKCTLCLGCLHRCPVFAIQYGKHTKAHGQYENHMRDAAR